MSRPLNFQPFLKRGCSHFVGFLLAMTYPTVESHAAVPVHWLERLGWEVFATDFRGTLPGRALWLASGM